MRAKSRTSLSQKMEVKSKPPDIGRIEIVEPMNEDDSVLTKEEAEMGSYVLGIM